jgi:hypothetical protein
MVESKREELKDQVSTRADAIKEDLKNPDWKNNKASNVIDDLTKDKNEVKAGTLGETIKNSAIDGYEGTKDALGNAAQYVSETIQDWTSGSK